MATVKQKFEERKLGVSGICPVCNEICKIGNVTAKIEAFGNVDMPKAVFNEDLLFNTMPTNGISMRVLDFKCPKCNLRPSSMILFPSDMAVAIATANAKHLFVRECTSKEITFFNIYRILYVSLSHTSAGRWSSKRTGPKSASPPPGYWSIIANPAILIISSARSNLISKPVPFGHSRNLTLV